MNEPLTREQVIDLLPLYVLGALEVDELLAVDDYVQANPDIQAELADMEEAAALIAFSAPTVSLPEAPKASLMARIQEEAAAPIGATAVKTAVSPPSVTKTQQPMSPSLWDTLQQLLFGQNRWALATAVSFVLLLILGANTLRLQSQLSSLQAENSSLVQTNAQLQQQLNQNNTVVAQLPSIDQTIPLPGTEEAPNANGVFYRTGDEAVFALRDLDPLPADQVYQLWLVPPGGGPPDAVSVGLLENLGEDGTAVQAVNIPAEVSEFYIVDVSIEPAGGSPNLSGPVVIRAQVEE